MVMVRFGLGASRSLRIARTTAFGREESNPVDQHSYIEQGNFVPIDGSPDWCEPEDGLKKGMPSAN
tara:strand:+ start:2182 stop:2379 length:198 start_codon:yes stop_codon:yes gene_type:complete